MVLSTEDYSELLQNIATKCAAQFSLIPSVSSTSSQISAQVGEVEADKGLFQTHQDFSEKLGMICLSTALHVVWGIFFSSWVFYFCH